MSEDIGPYQRAPFRQNFDQLRAKGMSITDALDELIGDVWSEAWSEGEEVGTENAWCSTEDYYHDVTADEYGMSADEWTAQSEHLAALKQFVRDVDQGMPPRDALSRLPISALWAST